MLATVQSHIDNTAKHGISRSTQFRLLGFSNVPDYVYKEFNEAPLGEGGVLYLKSGVVPGRSLQSIEINYLGHKSYSAGSAEYDPNPMELTFRVPEDYLWRNALEQWSFEIFNEETSNGSYSIPCPNTSLDIALLGRNGKIIRIYRLYSVFPARIGSIQYNLAENPSEVEFSVAFQYTRFKTIEVTDTGSIDASYLNRLDAEQKAIYEQYRNNILSNSSNVCQSGIPS